MAIQKRFEVSQKNVLQSSKVDKDTIEKSVREQMIIDELGR